jgi:hypothetical protein
MRLVRRFVAFAILALPAAAAGTVAEPQTSNSPALGGAALMLALLACLRIARPAPRNDEPEGYSYRPRRSSRLNR